MLMSIIGLLPLLCISVAAIIFGDSPIWIAALASASAASYTTKRGRRTGAEMSFMPFVGGMISGCAVLAYVAVWDWHLLVWMAALVGFSYGVHKLPKDHSPTGPLVRSTGIGLLVIAVIWPLVGSVELAVISGVIAFSFRYIHRVYMRPLIQP